MELALRMLYEPIMLSGTIAARVASTFCAPQEERHG